MVSTPILLNLYLKFLFQFVPGLATCVQYSGLMMGDGFELRCLPVQFCSIYASVSNCKRKLTSGLAFLLFMTGMQGQASRTRCHVAHTRGILTNIRKWAELVFRFNLIFSRWCLSFILISLYSKIMSITTPKIKFWIIQQVQIKNRVSTILFRSLWITFIVGRKHLDASWILYLVPSW